MKLKPRKSPKFWRELEIAYEKRLKAGAWKRKNSYKHNAHCAKYKAAKLKHTLSWLTQDHFKTIEQFYKIAKQKSIDTGIPHEVDHIVPLQGKNVSGLHVPWNLQILTKSENASKNNR